MKFLKGVVKLAAFLGIGGIPPMLMAMSESKKTKGTTDTFAPKGRELTHAVEKSSKKLGITR